METINSFIEDLTSNDCDVRWQAARALRWLKDDRTVGPLMEALRDSDCNVRWSAAESLVTIGHAAAKPLIKR